MVRMFQVAILVILLGVRRGVGNIASGRLSLHCVIVPWSTGPSSPKSCCLEVVVNVSVTGIFFIDRVVSPMATPLTSGRGDPVCQASTH